MKTLIRLIALVLMTVMLFELSSCVPARTVMMVQRDRCQLNIKTVPIRLVGNDDMRRTCINSPVTFSMEPSRFTLSLSDTTIQLKGLYRYSADREYYEGYTEDMRKYTLYYYVYRDRIYIQITPLHNGQVPFIDSSEVIYIVTTDDICS